MSILLKTTLHVGSFRRIFYGLCDLFASPQGQSTPGEPQLSCPAHAEFVICDCTIELFFKRLKQCLRLHELVLKDWERASCVVQLNLIVWWLQEQEAQWMREVLTSVLEPLAEDVHDLSADEESQGEQEAEAWILSSWTLAHFCCEQVRTMLRGAWSRRRVQECQQALRRYVRSHKRKRGHRESEQRTWLQSRGRQRRAGSA